MTTPVQVEANIDGRIVRTVVPARRRLADFLRDDLGLLGTKLSCEVQVCGTCTVLVDGLPVSSCTYLAADVDGRTVTTIEGLGTEGDLSCVQRSFLDAGAVQCGFCTPGLVLAVTALLEDDPSPSDQEIRHFLEGNICRCTGYDQILDAVRISSARLAKESRGG